MSVKQRIALVILILSLTTVSARAANTSSITVDFIPGVCFRIYQIATFSDGEYTPTPVFSQFVLPSGNAAAGDWREFTIQLWDYAEKSQIMLTQTVTTKENGQAVFHDLSAGLYLLTADPFSSGGQLYIPGACILPLHQENITVHPKYSVQPEDRPDTGDAAVPEIWAVLMMISAAGFLILLKKASHS